MDRLKLEDGVRDLFTDRGWPDRYDTVRDKLQSEDIVDWTWRFINAEPEPEQSPIPSGELSLVSQVTSDLRTQIDGLRLKTETLEREFCAYRIVQNKWYSQVEASLFAIGKKKKGK